MQNKPFRIGLCMAGAVSAGAYTAGVMDFLLEALGNWEKKRGEANVPSHRVQIPVMGGASAGGMTALLAASTINNTLVPVDIPVQDKLYAAHPENKFYHSWVDLTANDMFPKMLDTSDIAPGKVVSLLNARFIDEVAQKMIRANADQWQKTPAYFESPVKVFVTLSNLEGYNYNVDFISARKKDKYNMSVHNDYACFELTDENMTASKGWMPLNFKTGESLATAREAAMATGAFPLGLRAREITREASHINEIGWLKDVFNKNPLPPGLKKSLHVDGGMINNEPFEKVRDILDNITVENNPETFKNLEDRESLLFDMNSRYSTFENTVLMIDPFPGKEEVPNFDFSDDLLAIAGKTLSAMTAQMRAKPADYRSAMETADASQFLISPSRLLTAKNGEVLKELFGEEAIACGTLAGFGGFLSKEFRIHDYYLGRHNCEVFLRDYFTIPESELQQNKIFRDGYAGIDASDYLTVVDGIRSLPIIPLFTPRPAPFTIKMPIFSSGTNWPAIEPEKLKHFEKPLRSRIQKIVLNTAALNSFTNALLWIGAKVILNKTLADKVMDAIKKSLAAWDLLDNRKK